MTQKLAPVSPGEVLKEEFLQPYNITMTKLAAEIGVPVNRISQIVAAKREITADTALRLGHYFGTSAKFWMNLQSCYNLERTKDETGAAISKQVKPLKPHVA